MKAQLILALLGASSAVQLRFIPSEDQMSEKEHDQFLHTIRPIQDQILTQNQAELHLGSMSHARQMAQVKTNVGVRFYTNNDNYDEKRPGWSSTMGPARITKEDYADEYGKKDCQNNEKLEELTSSWMNDPNADAVKDRLAELDNQAQTNYANQASRSEFREFFTDAIEEEMESYLKEKADDAAFHPEAKNEKLYTNMNGPPSV